MDLSDGRGAAAFDVSGSEYSATMGLYSSTTMSLLGGRESESNANSLPFRPQLTQLQGLV
jgi:hypothetical protein